MVWGMVGLGAASAGLGVLGQVNASNLSYNKARKLAEYQALLNYQYNTRWAKESPSLTRQGLESAGYNPMLAVQNGTTGSNASSFTSGATANDVDLSTPIQSGFNNVMAYKNMENQTAMTDSNIKLNEANSRSAIADAISKEIHNQYLDDREQKEIGKLSAETTKLESDSAYNSALIKNLKDRLELDYTLGMMGIDTQRRGQDLSYNASTYSSDNALRSIMYSSDKSYKTSTLNSFLSHPYLYKLRHFANNGRDYKGSYRDPWLQK